MPRRKKKIVGLQITLDERSTRIVERHMKVHDLKDMVDTIRNMLGLVDLLNENIESGGYIFVKVGSEEKKILINPESLK